MKRFKLTKIILLYMLVMMTFVSGTLFADNNPVISDPNADVADPEILYANGRYWIYPTYCTSKDWMSTYFKCWSSTNLVDWTDEGVILNTNNISWGSSRVWAPAIAERNGTYYYYFCLEHESGGIGVATSSNPA